MSIVKLPIMNGGVTLVDDDISEKLEGKRLFLTNSRRYVSFWDGKRQISLHRFIMNDPKGMDIDHIDGNRHDNRRCNLRVCTHSENCRNMRNGFSALSGYRLVYKDRKHWSIKISVNSRSVHLTNLISKHIAAVFADQVLVNLVGPFVRKNFEKKISSSCLADFLTDTSGKIFRVVFSRRSDGRQREMVCRTGVKAHQSGGTILFNPISRNLFSVYDVQKKAYRFIPLENVICIRFAKKNYRVVA